MEVPMTIYVDVDGTLTGCQTGNSYFNTSIPKREDVLNKVRRAAEAGAEIFIWSGSTKYARQVADDLRAMGIKIEGAMRKPHLMIDNEKGKWSCRLARRVVTPEEYLGI
jgi:hypothetical protein